MYSTTGTGRRYRTLMPRLRNRRTLVDETSLVIVCGTRKMLSRQGARLASACSVSVPVRSTITAPYRPRMRSSCVGSKLVRLIVRLMTDSICCRGRPEQQRNDTDIAGVVCTARVCRRTTHIAGRPDAWFRHRVDKVSASQEHDMDTLVFS